MCSASFTTYSSTINGDVWAFLGRMFSGEVDKNGLTVFMDIGPDGAMRSDPWRWYRFIFTDKMYASGDSVTVGSEISTMGATLFNTVFYAIGIPIGMILSIFLAVCMSRDIKGTNAFRVIYYIPTVASTVSIAIMWTNLFGSNGFITQLLGVNFITGEGATYWTQRWCIIILTVWKGLGGTVVLFVAGLNGVNASYHEAAEIDGANAWQIFWRITMPQLYPTIFYVLVTSVIGGMQIFAEPDLVFNGYPVAGNQATNGTRFNTPFVGFIYGNFEQGEWAHASALGIVLAVIIFVLTLIQFGLDSRREKI